MSWDIIGHEWAVDLLKSHIRNEEIRHAYLMTGPQGVGRRTLALRLAQAINCSAPPMPGELCRECQHCIRIERMQHPDLDIVGAEREGGIIKVDQIRELQYRLSLAPYEARYRIAILQRFEEANESASNALLKILEEPPPKVILILTAESAERLLPTIPSRCEVMRLRPVSFEVIKAGLRTQLGIKEDQAGVLAHLSGGCPGNAVRLFHQPERLELRKLWLDQHYALLSAGRLDRFAYAYLISKDRDNLRNFLTVLMSFWRDILHRAADSKTPLFNPDRNSEINELAASLNTDTAYSVITEIERTLALLDRNINTRLAVEVLFMNMPRVG